MNVPEAELRLVDLGPLTERQRAELEGDDRDPFDMGEITLQFQPKQHRVGLIDRDGRAVAAAGMLAVEVEVGGERFPVVGLGGVIVAAGYRGRGLARRVVTAALERAALLGPDFMLLFCLPDRVGLYLRLGFAEVGNPVTVQQPRGTTEMPLGAMWRALRPGAQWPPGPVALLGLPF